MSKPNRKRQLLRRGKPARPRAERRHSTLQDVCNSPDLFLRRLDIAELNLLCASGLPGAEEINLDQTQTWLAKAARRVDYETRRHMYRFLATPASYNDSPGYFCCYFLLQVLQEDFGVKYNPARVRDPTFQDPKCLEPDFRDSRDLFIHGIIDGPGGTCASMPVVYVAVGRRLGYPLKLVESRGHLFFRWDGASREALGSPERFNIDGAGHGISSFPDEHYRNWPETWTAAETAAGCYLKSLSQTEELAAFLATRGECLHDNGRMGDAIQAYQWVCALLPNDARYRWRLTTLIRRSQKAILEIQETIAFNRMARDLSQRQHLSQIAAAPVIYMSHGNSCMCRQCITARQQSSASRRSGHAPNCPCPLCRNPSAIR
jgi:hypothetical protein